MSLTFPRVIVSTVDPTLTNNSTQGYIEGNLWVNTTTKVIFICVDPINGVWRNYEPSGSISTHNNSTSSHPDIRLLIPGNATTTTPGKVELATNVETQDGLDSTRAVTPAGLSSRTATESRTGVVRLAGNTTTKDGLDSTSAVTPASLKFALSTFVAKTCIPLTTGDTDIGTSLLRYRTVYADWFDGTSAQATYADLAEKYTCINDDDLLYTIGTVVSVSTNDNAEVEVCDKDCSYNVVGVISENPAFLMNKESLGRNIALTGKVPVRVMGPIKKGDPIVSAGNGCARSIMNGMELLYKIGISLETDLGKDEKLIYCIIK